jgi:diguanylate cyclase (GGDEF)-like protein/PAS domain S-box-containing protein
MQAISKRKLKFSALTFSPPSSRKSMNASLNVYALRKKMTDMSNDSDPHGERKMERLRDVYLALAQINQAVMHIGDQDKLFSDICRIAVEQGHFHMAWIGLADKQTQTIVPAASHGCDLHLLNQIAISIDPDKREGHGPIASALRTNQPTVCNDFSGSPQSASWRSVAVSIGFHSVACFPFHGTNEITGTLNLYTAEKHFFDDTTTHLIEQMTRDISFALNSRARDAVAAAADEIAELKRNQATLRENALRYRQLVELSPETIFVCREGKFVLVNQAAVRMLGARTASALIGRDVLDFIQSDYQYKFDARQKALLFGVAAVPFDEQVWQRADGSRFHAEVAATRLVFDGAPALQVVVRDISLRKRTEQMQTGQNRILNMVATGVELPRILREIALFMETHAGRGMCSIMLLDVDNNRLHDGASPSLPDEYVQAIGAIPVDASGGSSGTAALRAEPVIVADIAHDPLWMKHRDAALAQGLTACSSWPIIGKERNVLGTISLYFETIVHPTARDIELFGICADLAAVAIERRQAEESIRRLAHYDGLTSLPNRFLFTEFLDQALRKAHRQGKRFAVFFIDLDKFKEVNDTFGHDAGDAVLKEIACRLRRSLRQSDKIARMGGDEFYVLIEDLQDGDDAAEIAEKLLEEAVQPIRFGQHECTVSASIGIAVYPHDGATAQALLRNSDDAMYQAKTHGKNGYRFFSSPKQKLRHDDRRTAFHFPTSR